MVVLVTPGHHEVTDTLIMYGFIKILKSLDPYLNIEIRNLGARYTIQAFVDIDKHDTEALITTLSLELENIVKVMKKEKEIGRKLQEMKKRKIKAPNDLKMAFTVLHQKSPAALDTNPVNSQRIVDNVNELIDKINDTKVNIIEIYLNNNHKNLKISKNCGHRKGGKGASLPILPIGGNYPKTYTMCDICQALSWIGLYNFAVRFIYDNKAIVGVFAFEDLAKDIDILLLRNFSEYTTTMRYWKELTTISLPLIVLSIGETPLAFSTNNWRFISFSLGGEGKAAAIRSYGSFNVANILTFLEKAKIYSPNLPRLIEELCRTSDGVLAISRLSEAIIYQNIDKLYSAFREIRQELSKAKREKLLDRGIIKAAFESVG